MNLPNRNIAHLLLSELRAEMARQGVTVRHLVEKTGIAESTLYKTFNGASRLSVDDLASICEVLDVPSHLLLARAERRQAESGVA